ncbi:MAG: PspC domain-containing protein [Flavobacteriales bacterium]|nr:PspC domain-containing protein [Flavobacteriales bacterium]
MKKTLTANINGTVFHIEEDAYDTLQRYLANIRAQFAGTEGRDEIMSDIEARIAELFNERLDGRSQVVTLADVEHVATIMGQPEDFADGEPAAGPDSAPEERGAPVKRTYKRFFRDPEDKWVGGVLGGLGAYIGMDPLWLRVAMIILVLASVGVLIPIYILLWILVPMADSAPDRLQMRGEPVTVENIKRVVEEGAERVKDGSTRMANEAKDIGKDWKRDAAQRKSQAAEIISKLFGVAIIVVAFSMSLGLITGLIGGTWGLWHATWSSEDVGLLELGGLFFNSQQQALWFAIGVIALMAIPLIGLFLAGFRLLLDTRTPKWLGWSLTLLWLAAWVPTMWGAAALGKDFHRENSVRTEETLVQPQAGILYLDALNVAEETEEWSVRFDDGGMDVDMQGLHVENGNIFGAWARLDVERSADSLFHLVVIREAHGATAKAAMARAEEIQYRVEQQGDVLLVSPVVSFSVQDKFRAQDVHFTLHVPVGKSIFLRPGSRNVIYDIDNVTNTLDDDMIGRTWTMTNEGLEDPSKPRPGKNEVIKGEVTPSVTDSTLSKKVAASVWRRPARKTAPRPNHATAAVTSTPVARVELPNVFKLLGLLGRP